jgi:hypothetical protein
MGTDRPGVRKATLTKRDVAILRLKIDCALQEEARRRLASSAIEFLTNINKIAARSVVRLSKKQRDTTDEIVSKALSEAPVVFLEDEGIAELVRLFRHAAGDPRISAFEENVLKGFKSRFEEPIIALSEKQWRIIEDIRRKTYFCVPGGPPPIDIDGIVENDDPDGLPPERHSTRDDPAYDWVMVGAEED